MAQTSVMQIPNMWLLCSTKTAVVKDSQQTKNRGLIANGWQVAFCHLGTNQKQSPEESSLRPHRPGLSYISRVQWVQT